MKKLFLSCLLPVFALAQNNTCSLQIKTDDKPSLHGFSYWQQIKVVSKDTSFTYRLHTQNPDVIPNLKPGTYKVAVSSVFNHYVSKKIELSKKTPLIKFAGLAAFYNKPKTAANLCEKLKLNDTLFVLYNRRGTDTLQEKFALTKTKYGYTAILYSGISNEVVHSMMISAEKYNFVVPKFEKEAKKAHSPKTDPASANNVCSIEWNKEILTFVIPGKWDGYDNLKAPLLVVEAK